MPNRPSLTHQAWSVIHQISLEDDAIVSAMRSATAPMKGKLHGVSARVPYDGIMGHVAPPVGVTYEEDSVGGIPGWWCRPEGASSESVLLHLHGGWFVFGSSSAYRSFVGQIASRAGVSAFVPDYALAPEHPFPAGLNDAQSCYQGLLDRGFKQIAIVGDSAGGCLGLVLTALLVSKKAAQSTLPVGVVVLSPVTDLALSGRSWETQAQTDPYFTIAQAKANIEAYLAGHDPHDPQVSPLYGDQTGLPPLRVYVGGAEVLLDDSRNYVEKAVSCGVDAKIEIWEGLPHVFTSNVGQLKGAEQALDSMGKFLSQRTSN